MSVFRSVKRQIVLAPGAIALALVGQMASAQSVNLIDNPGFEDSTTPSFGNNIGAGVTPWTVAPGFGPNVVRVDGPNGFNYRSSGPEGDADPTTGEGVTQRYLDIASGAGRISQIFRVPECVGGTGGASYSYGGSFSTRDNSSGTGSIQIHEGAVANDANVVAGSVLTANMPRGNSQFDPWVNLTGTITLDYDTDYTYVVDIGNPVNFDQAFLFLTALNCAPTADDDESLNNPIGSDPVVDVLDGDVAALGRALDPDTVALVDPATGDPVTTLLVAGQGTWSVNGDGDIVFMPLDTFTGNPDSVTYTVDDDQGNTSEPATVTVTYTAAPTADDDESLNNPIGSDPVVDVLDGDAAAPGRTLDPDTVALVDPAMGDPVTTLLVAGQGTWSVNGDGDIVFMPLDTFTGNPDPVTYTVADDQGNTSAPATVTVTFAIPPTTVADESMDNPLGEPVDVDVLANDSAADGRTLDATTVALLDPAGNPVTTLVVPGEGTWTVAPTGVVTFTPEDGFTGSPTPVRYTVDDDLGNTSVPATITVGYVPDVDIDAIEEVLSDDLARTTRLLSASASNISRRAADRLRVRRGQTCGQEINDLLKSNPVRFASDTFFIDPRNDAVLDEITRLLGECSASSFMIAGHTDSDASDAYNITLSQNRVDAVRDALAQRGVSVERLQTQGFGESRPIATNATVEGQALNRRVEFILLDESIAAARACGDDNLLSRNVNGTGNDDGANLAGDFRSTGYNCATDTYSETWGELSITQEDDRGTTGMLRVGTSRERQNGNTLVGGFIEAYLSKSDVNTPDATGSITGVGLHAGLYGAHGTDGGLILSYYGSGAIGRHNFELDTGAVADGNYTYAGLFAGAAVGGEYATETLTVLPRVGIDLAYAKAIGSEISVPDVDLEIDPSTYARGFIELGLSHETDNGTFDVAPRLFCETNGDVDVNACGYGASFNYATLTADNGTQWDVTFDYEQITDRQTASLRVARSRDIFDGLGVSQSSFGATQTGAFEAAQTIAFSW